MVGGCDDYVRNTCLGRKASHVRCAMEANHSAWRHYSDPSYGDSVRSVVWKRDTMMLRCCRWYTSATSTAKVLRSGGGGTGEEVGLRTPASTRLMHSRGEYCLFGTESGPNLG